MVWHGEGPHLGFYMMVGDADRVTRGVGMGMDMGRGMGVGVCELLWVGSGDGFAILGTFA